MDVGGTALFTKKLWSRKPERDVHETRAAAQYLRTDPRFTPLFCSLSRLVHGRDL